jgi:hypothetical protein
VKNIKKKTQLNIFSKVGWNFQSTCAQHTKTFLPLLIWGCVLVYLFYICIRQTHSVDKIFCTQLEDFLQDSLVIPNHAKGKIPPLALQALTSYCTNVTSILSFIMYNILDLPGNDLVNSVL